MKVRVKATGAILEVEQITAHSYMYRGVDTMYVYAENAVEVIE